MSKKFYLISNGDFRDAACRQCWPKQQETLKAVEAALRNTGISEYFSSQHPLQQTLSMSSAGTPGVSPALLIAFSPGVTKEWRSQSHDIHTYLRKQSANRIPIFGGASGDYFQWESNYQIANDGVFTDSIILEASREVYFEASLLTRSDTRSAASRVL